MAHSVYITDNISTRSRPNSLHTNTHKHLTSQNKLNNTRQLKKACKSPKYRTFRQRAKKLLKCVRIPSSRQTEDELHCAPNPMELHVCFNVPRTTGSQQSAPDRIISQNLAKTTQPATEHRQPSRQLLFCDETGITNNLNLLNN